MDCPFCPTCNEYVQPPRPRVSLWMPIALIVAVLGAASFASAFAPDARDDRAPGASVAKGSAL